MIAPECIGELLALAARRGHFYVGIVVVLESFVTSFPGPWPREGGPDTMAALAFRPAFRPRGQREMP
jgi:hypothetical protein